MRANQFIQSNRVPNAEQIARVTSIINQYLDRLRVYLDPAPYVTDLSRNSIHGLTFLKEVLQKRYDETLAQVNSAKTALMQPTLGVGTNFSELLNDTEVVATLVSAANLFPGARKTLNSYMTNPDGFDNTYLDATSILLGHLINRDKMQILMGAIDTAIELKQNPEPDAGRRHNI